MSLRKFYLAGAASILIFTGGCNFVQGGGDGGGSSEAQPANVSSQELQAAVSDEPLRSFYAARDWQPAWNDQRAQQLTQTLQGAGRHGLDPTALTADIAQAQAPVDREIALSRAALTYAGALARGRTDPTQLADVYTVARNDVDVPAGFAEAVRRDNVGEWIEGLAPQDDEYRALSQAYVEAMQAGQQQQQQGGAETATGNQQAAAQPEAAATRNSQQTKAKGAQEDRAQAAPAAVPADRAVILAVNLERRRWLPREAPGTRIDVNTAATFLRYFREGQLADQRIVVVGEPGWETPELGSPIYRLVANPDWTVPASIEQDELGSLSAAALARRNMSRENGRLVQQPGPQNALGLVKFDMRNDEAIYLHDTPAKQMFGRSDRHLSHGCVRVNDALGFARMLAEHAGKLDEFNRALATEDTTFVNLDQEIPVRLLYHTAYVDGGRIMFQPDSYGWDAAVAEGLGLPRPAVSQEAREAAQRRRSERQSGGGDYGP